MSKSSRRSETEFFLTRQKKKELEVKREELQKKKKENEGKLNGTRMRKHGCNSELSNLTQNATSLNRRIKKINKVLKNHTLVEDLPEADGVAKPGRVVRLKFVSSGVVDEYFLGRQPDNCFDMLEISPKAPLGKAIINREVGEVVEYENHDQKKQAVKILEVKKGC